MYIGCDNLNRLTAHLCQKKWILMVGVARPQKKKKTKTQSSSQSGRVRILFTSPFRTHRSLESDNATMVRFKYRYLVVETNQSPEQVKLSKESLSDSIKGSIQENFGDYGSGLLLPTYQGSFCSEEGNQSPENRNVLVCHQFVLFMAFFLLTSVSTPSLIMKND
jgi:RNase P/RNase MRP subunit POP5